MTATSAPEAPGRRATDIGWGHHFVRTSGLVLLVLFAAHVVWLFVLNDIQKETAAAFAERWSNPLWRAVDWGLVVLSLVHGTIGLRPVVASGIRSPQVRGVVLGALYVLVGVLLSLVTFVAFTYRFAA
ncbi:MAG: succinate dehydrogenase [Actinobacteria bacterium]|nr:succinate dehydrogenase [Actinomycetota bacterium]